MHLVEAEPDKRPGAGWHHGGIGEPVCSTVMVLSAISPLPPRFSRSRFAVTTTRLQGRNLEAATGRDRTRAVFGLERIEGGPHKVIGVGGAERLRHDVLHTDRLEHRTHRARRR